ncbi:MAG: hypothetical protein M3P40_00855 [Actinomycetota bacterium]|nr:hypothetical protein [Actinomycetota bacterium]
MSFLYGVWRPRKASDFTSPVFVLRRLLVNRVLMLFFVVLLGVPSVLLLEKFPTHPLIRALRWLLGVDPPLRRASEKVSLSRPGEEPVS